MPKLFGEKYPDIPDKIAFRIFYFLDRESLSNCMTVNKDWYKIAREAKNFSNIYQIIHRRVIFFRNLDFWSFGVSRLSGWSNSTFKLTTSSGHFVLRIPGKGSEQYINRCDESINSKISSKLGINAEILFFDKEDGLQVTRYIENATTMSSESFKYKAIIIRAMVVLKSIHTSPTYFSNKLNVFRRNNKIYSLLAQRKLSILLLSKYHEIIEKMILLEKIIETIGFKLVPCHNDTTPENFIESGYGMQLIDWEYSGNNDIVWDLAYLSIEASFSKQQDLWMFEAYFGENKTNLFDYYRFILYKPVVELWISLWANLQISNGNKAVEEEELHSVAKERLEHCQQLLVSTDFLKAQSFLSAKAQSLIQKRNNRFWTITLGIFGFVGFAGLGYLIGAKIRPNNSVFRNRASFFSGLGGSLIGACTGRKFGEYLSRKDTQELSL